MIQISPTHPCRDLLHLLTAYCPKTYEQGTYHQFVEFVQHNPQCLLRETLPGHVTGSAWVVNPGQTRVLLTLHRKLGRWLQLGGHADGEGNLLRVAWQEAREESGIEEILPLSEQIFDLGIHPIPARKGEPEHYHYDVRFVFQAQHEAVRVSKESLDLAWVDMATLESLGVADGLLRMRDKFFRLC